MLDCYPATISASIYTAFGAAHAHYSNSPALLILGAAFLAFNGSILYENFAIILGYKR